MNKKRLFEGKQTKLAQKISHEGPKEGLKEVLGLEGKLTRATFTLPESDIQWLTEVTREYQRKRSPIRISKSELVRIGLHRLKEEGIENILKKVI